MKRLLAAVVASAGLILSASAYAQFNGPEVGVQGGYGWGNSNGTERAVFPFNTPYSSSTSGGLIGGHAGYNFEFGQIVLGVEGDAEYAHVDGSVHGVLDFDASLRGKLGYAFDRWMPYATGGLAFGDVKSTYWTPVGTKIGSQDDTRVGWTAGAGIQYAVTPNWSTGIEYRYTDLGHDTFSSSKFGFQDHNEFNYNAVRLNVTYRFAPPPPPPPMAEPMPAAAPAPPPMAPARTFLVFFDFDKYNLTSDARRVIEAAAASYKATGSARIEVSGYTDLAGSQAYNLRLSQRRADAVAGFMVRQGVPKNVMDVKWFGKEHPRVPTPDGVREPQNRRVEIVMP